MKSELIQLLERFDRVENKLDKHTDTLSGIETHLAKLNGRTARCEEKILSLEEGEKEEGNKWYDFGKNFVFVIIGIFASVFAQLMIQMIK